MEKNLNPRITTFLIISIIISALVFALKYFAYLKSHSIAIYSDAMESIINIIVSIIALIAVRISIMPADRNHPFGHNKAEYFSAAIEAILIMLTAIAILSKIYIEATHNHTKFIINESLYYGIIAASIQAIWGSVILLKAKEYNAISLRADALHLLSDAATAWGIVIGLIIGYYTQYYLIDYAIAVFIALNISWHGWHILKKAIGGLMDRGVDKATYEEIKNIIADNGSGALEAHDIKTRLAGYVTFIEFHLVVEAEMSVITAHNICNKIERALQQKFENTRITIHIEPPEESKIHKDRLPII